MKTAMMVTTALVGASLIAGPAFASDPPELKMSGHARAELWFGSQDDESGRGDRSPHMETDDAEISFDAKATADNGLLYGLHMELDMDDAGDRVDEANVFFEGNWGRLELGDQDGAEDVMLYGGTNNLVANGGYDGGAASFFDFNGVSASSPDMAGDTGDATKITYFTPRFGGFQVGVSYTPDDDHNFTESLASADGTNEHHFGLAANYVESFNGVDVAVGGSIVTADQEGGTAAVPQSATNAADRAGLQTTGLSLASVNAILPSDAVASSAANDEEGYHVGFNISYSGISFGASHGDNGDSNVASGSSADAGQWWELAVGYKTGPWAAHAGYFHGEQDPGGGASDDETDFFTLGVNYVIAPGLRAYAEFDHIEVDQAGSGDGVDNEGDMFMVGTNVSF